MQLIPAIDENGNPFFKLDDEATAQILSGLSIQDYEKAISVAKEVGLSDELVAKMKHEIRKLKLLPMTDALQKV